MPVSAGTEIASSSLEELAAQVQAAEDIEAIKTLTHTYGYLVDKALWSDVLDLFTQDPSVEYSAGTYTGRENVGHYWTDEFGRGVEGLPRGRLTNHIMMQPVITLGPTGVRASGRWRSLIQNAVSGGASNWLSGVYEIQYAKVDDVWHIDRIQYYARVYGSYDKGWIDEDSIRRPPPAPTRFPPNSPPTKQSSTYPAMASSTVSLPRSRSSYGESIAD